MDVDLETPAGRLLTVRLESHPGGRLRRAGRYLTALVTAALGWGAYDGPGPAVPAHLIVVRRDTGEELHRIASDLYDAHLSDYVREQLATLTVGQFCERWGIPLGPGRNGARRGMGRPGSRLTSR